MERKECYSELQFFDDYLLLHIPKLHSGYKNDKKVIQKIYYADVEECIYKVKKCKFEIQGKIEELQYKYKDGIVWDKYCYRKNYIGEIEFYTVFDKDVSFIEIIENNSPLKVVIKDM